MEAFFSWGSSNEARQPKNPIQSTDAVSPGNGAIQWAPAPASKHTSHSSHSSQAPTFSDGVSSPGTESRSDVSARSSSSTRTNPIAVPDTLEKLRLSERGHSSSEGTSPAGHTGPSHTPTSAAALLHPRSQSQDQPTSQNASTAPALSHPSLTGALGWHASSSSSAGSSSTAGVETQGNPAGERTITAIGKSSGSQLERHKVVDGIPGGPPFLQLAGLPPDIQEKQARIPVFNDEVTSDVRIHIALPNSGDMHTTLALHLETLREQSDLFFTNLPKPLRMVIPSGAGGNTAPGEELQKSGVHISMSSGGGFPTQAGSHSSWHAAAKASEQQRVPLIPASSVVHVTLKASGHVADVEAYVTALKLFYEEEEDLPAEIQALGNVALVLDVLQAAWEMQFHTCVSACIDFLSSVPWTEKEQHVVAQRLQHLDLEHEEVSMLIERLPTPPAMPSVPAGTPAPVAAAVSFGGGVVSSLSFGGGGGGRTGPKDWTEGRQWTLAAATDAVRSLMAMSVVSHGQEMPPGLSECRDAVEAILRQREEDRAQAGLLGSASRSKDRERLNGGEANAVTTGLLPPPLPGKVKQGLLKETFVDLQQSLWSEQQHRSHGKGGLASAAPVRRSKTSGPGVVPSSQVNHRKVSELIPEGGEEEELLLDEEDLMSPSEVGLAQRARTVAFVPCPARSQEPGAATGGKEGVANVKLPMDSEKQSKPQHSGGVLRPPSVKLVLPEEGEEGEDDVDELDMAAYEGVVAATPLGMHAGAMGLFYGGARAGMSSNQLVQRGLRGTPNVIYGRRGCVTWLVRLMVEFSMADEVFKWLATDREFVNMVQKACKWQQQQMLETRQGGRQQARRRRGRRVGSSPGGPPGESMGGRSGRHWHNSGILEEALGNEAGILPSDSMASMPGMSPINSSLETEPSTGMFWIEEGSFGSLYVVREAVLGTMGAMIAKKLVVSTELRAAFARLWLPILSSPACCQVELPGPRFFICGVELDSEERAIVLFGFNELVLTLPAHEQQSVYAQWQQICLAAGVPPGAAGVSSLPLEAASSSSFSAWNPVPTGLAHVASSGSMGEGGKETGEGLEEGRRAAGWATTNLPTHSKEGQDSERRAASQGFPANMPAPSANGQQQSARGRRAASLWDINPSSFKLDVSGSFNSRGEYLGSSKDLDAVSEESYDVKSSEPEPRSWFSLSGAYKRWLTRFGLPCSIAGELLSPADTVLE